MGHRPVSPIRIGYENVYLYLTLCPFTGQGYASFLPKLNAHWFGWFIKQVEGSLAGQSLFMADGAKAHKANLFNKAKLMFRKLPPYCPELNPVERVFKSIRQRLKHRVFSSLDEAQNRIQAIVEDLFHDAGKVISLSCFPYIKNTSSSI